MTARIVAVLSTLLMCTRCGQAPYESLIEPPRAGIEVSTSTCGWARRDCDSDCSWICQPNDAACMTACLETCQARPLERFCRE